MNTRTFYDESEKRSYEIKSKKPMQYITDPEVSTRFFNFASRFEVDTGSDLRVKSTRSNEIGKVTTEMYGTAPFKGRNDGPVDTESSLRHGLQVNTCNRLFTEIEKQTDIPGDAPIGVPVHNHPASSRNDYVYTRRDFR